MIQKLTEQDHCVLKDLLNSFHFPPANTQEEIKRIFDWWMYFKRTVKQIVIYFNGPWLNNSMDPKLISRLRFLADRIEKYEEELNQKEKEINSIVV